MTTTISACKEGEKRCPKCGGRCWRDEHPDGYMVGLWGCEDCDWSEPKPIDDGEVEGLSPTETVSDCCGAKVSSRNVFIDPPMKINRLIDIEYVCTSCHQACNINPLKPTIEELWKKHYMSKLEGRVYAHDVINFIRNNFIIEGVDL